jgi:glycosyltransferase involved in cell wall biosynthesis
MSTAVVIPAFNEARVIRTVVSEVLDRGYTVVVVDDCSTDGTAAALAGLPCHVLRHSVNLGQGAALQTGISYAVAHGAQSVVTFDADGQHDPDQIGGLLAALVDHDVALGSRFLGTTVGMGAGRRVLLRAAVLFSRLTTGLDLSDAHNGLRAFRVSVAERLTLTQNRMAHASEFLGLIARHRLRYVEVPCTIRYSDYSKAKGQSALGAVDILADLFQRRFLS